MPIVEDGWLAERFGHPVWSVRGASSTAVQDHVAAHPGRALYQAKVATSDVSTVLDLAKAGLVAVNVNSVLARSPGVVDMQPAAGVTVRELDPSTDEGVLAIAADAFERTRFHLDPRVPDAVADAIKRDWIDSYLRRRRGEFAYVAVQDDSPVGFLAVARHGDTRIIDLMGVAVAARGRGVGAALVGRFVADAAEGCSRVEVGTQAANAPATRFYERAGFRAERALYDLHRLEG